MNEAALIARATTLLAANGVLVLTLYQKVESNRAAPSVEDGVSVVMVAACLVGLCSAFWRLERMGRGKSYNWWDDILEIIPSVTVIAPIVFWVLLRLGLVT